MRLVLLLLLSGCGGLNQKSRDYYNDQHPKHHGIRLISVEAQVQNIREKLDGASLARGKVLYQQNCLPCHGETGEGDGPMASQARHKPANLRKVVQHVTHFNFYLDVSQWQGTMPGWSRHYDDVERQDLATYLKSFR